MTPHGRLLLLVLLGLLCSYLYSVGTGVHCDQACVQTHHAILDGTAFSPYRYRILAPLLIGFLPAMSVNLAYVAAHFLVFPLMFLFLDKWLRQFQSQNVAFIGSLILMAYMPMMLEDWWLSLYNALEVIFLCAGLALLVHRPRGWQPFFAALTIISTLNRETAILLPLAALAMMWGERGAFRQFGLFLVCWLTTFVALRLLLGGAPEYVSITQLWALNTSGGWQTTLAVVKQAFFMPIWILCIRHLRHAPMPLQRLALVGLPYVLLLLIFARWGEVRLLLPLLVLWLPSALKGD